MNGRVHIANQPSGSLEVELLRLARAESPPTGDFARLAAALGVGGPTGITIAASGSAASSIRAIAPGSGSGAAAEESTLETAAHASSQGVGLATPIAATLGAGAAVTALTSNVVKARLLSATTIRWLLLGGAGLVIAVGVTVVMKGQRREGASVPAVDSVCVSPVMPTASTAHISAGFEPDVARNALPQMATVPGLASLAPEIALLDQARALVSAGQPDAAIHLLDSYETQFPTGTLAPEAGAIRVQALLLSGNRARAREVGMDFLSRAPASPHAHKIWRLFGSETDRQTKRVK